MKQETALKARTISPDNRKNPHNIHTTVNIASNEPTYYIPSLL